MSELAIVVTSVLLSCGIIVLAIVWFVRDIRKHKHQMFLDDDTRMPEFSVQEEYQKFAKEIMELNSLAQDAGRKMVDLAEKIRQK